MTRLARPASNPDAALSRSQVRALATFPDEPELEVSGSPALLFLLEACHGQQPFLEDKDSATRWVGAHSPLPQRAVSCRLCKGWG